MEYRRFGDTIIARLDNGEKITEQVKRLAEAEKITLATVEGLGSVYNFSVGIFDAKNKLSHFDNFRVPIALPLMIFSGSPICGLRPAM